MPEALDQGFGDVGDVLGRPVQQVVLEHGDDLVVGLAPVDHLDPADDARADDDLRAADRALADHAHVEGVAVGAGRVRGQRGDARTAERARDEAVEGRGQGRRPLRAVAFGRSEWAEPLACHSGPLALHFTAEINRWNGRESVELRLTDWQSESQPAAT